MSGTMSGRSAEARPQRSTRVRFPQQRTFAFGLSQLTMKSVGALELTDEPCKGYYFMGLDSLRPALIPYHPDAESLLRPDRNSFTLLMKKHWGEAVWAEHRHEPGVYVKGCENLTVPLNVLLITPGATVANPHPNAGRKSTIDRGQEKRAYLKQHDQDTCPLLECARLSLCANGDPQQALAQARLLPGLRHAASFVRAPYICSRCRRSLAYQAWKLGAAPEADLAAAATAAATTVAAANAGTAAAMTVPATTAAATAQCAAAGTRPDMGGPGSAIGSEAGAAAGEQPGPATATAAAGQGAGTAAPAPAANTPVPGSKQPAKAGPSKPRAKAAPKQPVEDKLYCMLCLPPNHPTEHLTILSDMYAEKLITYLETHADVPNRFGPSEGDLLSFIEGQGGEPGVESQGTPWDTCLTIRDIEAVLTAMGEHHNVQKALETGHYIADINLVDSKLPAGLVKSLLLQVHAAQKAQGVQQPCMGQSTPETRCMFMVGGLGTGTPFHHHDSTTRNQIFAVLVDGRGVLRDGLVLATWAFCRPRAVPALHKLLCKLWPMRYGKTRGLRSDAKDPLTLIDVQRLETELSKDHVLGPCRTLDGKESQWLVIKEQRAGDRILVPAGWPHMVVNHHPCAKVAWDDFQASLLPSYMATANTMLPYTGRVETGGDYIWAEAEAMQRIWDQASAARALEAVGVSKKQKRA